MSRYTNALKIVMGIAIPLSIPANYLTEKFLKTGYVEVAHAIDAETNKGVMCQKVKDLLYYEVGDVTWEYMKGHASSIGTSCYKNEEIVCGTWLKNYYKWLANKTLDELPTIPDSLPEIPSFPSFPSIPNILGDIKQSGQIIALFAMGFILLIVYMISGKGKKGIAVR